MVAAETVDQLASHVQKFNDFWQSPAHAGLFGKLWKGSETPFDEIRFGIKYREFLREHLASLPQGQFVVQRFTSMTATEILFLSKFAKNGHFYRSLPLQTRSVFGKREFLRTFCF